MFKFRQLISKLLPSNRISYHLLYLQHHHHHSASAFSLELERTLRSVDVHSDMLAAYAAHIPRMVASFEMQKTARQKLREGHLKKSFVYLLIDPRVSENLPGEAAHDNTRLATWERFLRSIFYVGKGKNGRPYDHLYDALEAYAARPTDLMNGSINGESISGMMAAVVPESPRTSE